MLNSSDFSILSCCVSHPGSTRRLISEATGLSLGSVDSSVERLRLDGCLSEANEVSPKGLRLLDPYRVRNAVIMAAGLSSRFAPLSYETPKGLLRVKGEVLIERQIRQLKEAGIDDITVVVGYMKEKFFYLGDEFGVSIVVNNEYASRNNHSTIKCVESILGNTYVCSSDDYFTANPFDRYVYRSYYSALYVEGETDEYCLKTEGADRRITGATVGGRDAWVMMGHTYWDRAFCEGFLRELNAVYDHHTTIGKLWEDVYLDNVDKLDMVMRCYGPGEIWEFDSLDELRTFDSSFIDNIDSRIMDNICAVLGCAKQDIRDIVPIKQGLTNLSFRFAVAERAYVYRHPGAGTKDLVNRKSETFSQRVASSLGLDSTYLHEDEDEGWKISRYLNECSELDYGDPDQVAQALAMLSALHSYEGDSGFDFDVYQKTKETMGLLDAQRRLMFKDYREIAGMMDWVAERARAIGARRCLCHNDSYSPNFLVYDGGMDLIDWEYSGMSDYASDLGTFICCSDYSLDQAREVIEQYFKRPPTDEELFHCIAYTAIASFYWFIWALYKDACGDPVGEYLYLWYRYTKMYGAEARRLFLALPGD